MSHGNTNAQGYLRQVAEHIDRLERENAELKALLRKLRDLAHCDWDYDQMEGLPRDGCKCEDCTVLAPAIDAALGEGEPRGIDRHTEDLITAATERLALGEDGGE